jgi:hypothetical protein
VNHLVDDGAVVIRTHLGAAVLSAVGQVVTYEADAIDQRTRLGWSVIATGFARLVTDADNVVRYEQMLHPWMSGDMNQVTRIQLEIMTGYELVDDAAESCGCHETRLRELPSAAAGAVQGGGPVSGGRPARGGRPEHRPQPAEGLPTPRLGTNGHCTRIHQARRSGVRRDLADPQVRAEPAETRTMLITPTKPDRGSVLAALRLAVRAPSVRNTQPWGWRVEGRTIHLYADPSRRVPATDPLGRDLVISCGAALHHLLIALASSGWAGRVRRLPDPHRPDHLATVDLTPHVTTNAEAELAAAIPCRRTDRRKFGSWPLPGELIGGMIELAESEGLAAEPAPSRSPRWSRPPSRHRARRSCR